MSGEAGAAAVADVSVSDSGGGAADSGGGGAVDTSQNREPAQVLPKMGNGADGDDGDDGPANDNGAPRARTPKPQKHKVKLYGQEREFASLEDALPFLSDDYEHEIPVSGQVRKAKHPDLVRGYQLSEGAYDRMRKAAEVEKSWTERMEHAKQDPEWGLQMMFGVEDPLRWAAERVKKQMAIDKQLAELYESGNHFEHQRLVDKLADERKQRRDAFEANKQRAIAEQKQRAEHNARIEKDIRTAIEAAGLDWDATATIAHRIHQKYAAVGHQLAPADLAAMAKEQYIAQIYKHIDALDDDSLVRFLGDQRRARLRKFELNEVRKGSKPAAPAAPKPANTNGSSKPAGISEGDFLRQMRGGR